MTLFYNNLVMCIFMHIVELISLLVLIFMVYRLCVELGLIKSKKDDHNDDKKS